MDADILDYETFLCLEKWKNYLSTCPLNTPSGERFTGCFHPVELHPPRSPEGYRIKVNCGKCINCLTKRANTWFYRFKNEKSISLGSFFVTLTYSDEFLSDFHCLCVDHVQAFFKRVRRRGFSFTYALLGEYGPNTCRPHYHVAIFLRYGVREDYFRCFFPNAERFRGSNGLAIPDSFIVSSFRFALETCWNYGFVTIDDPTDNHLYYIAKYQTKLFLPYATIHLYSKRPSIGKEPMQDCIDSYFENGEKSIFDADSGRRYSIPRSFITRPDDDFDPSFTPRSALSLLEKYDSFETPEGAPSVDPSVIDQEKIFLSLAFQSFVKRKL